MEAICSSETSVETQYTTRRHIPEDDTLHTLNDILGIVYILMFGGTFYSYQNYVYM
jgi:hypothetical protein